MNKPIRRKNVTSAELIDTFILEKKASGITEKTINNYIESYNKLITDLNLDPLRIESKDILRWIEIMKENGNKPATINHYLIQTRVVLYWLMEAGFIDSFKIKLVKAQEELKAYSDADILKLVEKPRKDCSFIEYRTWMIIIFILSTGARASTVMNIKKSDIDYMNSTIAYRHLKNKKVFYAPMTIELEKNIKSYLKMWDIESEYLFCNCEGNQLSVHSAGEALGRYCNKRNVKSKGLHAFRHNFAKAWVKNGGNAFVLQKMLTHSDIAMTKKYVRLFDNEIKDDVQKYNALSSIEGK